METLELQSAYIANAIIETKKKILMKILQQWMKLILLNKWLKEEFKKKI